LLIIQDHALIKSSMGHQVLNLAKDCCISSLLFTTDPFASFECQRR